MSITRDDVAAVYLSLLARPPESEAVYDNSIKRDDLGGLIKRVAESPEFLDRMIGGMYAKLSDGLRPHNEEKIVYLHIPKCGGTTLHSLLEAWYGKDAVHRERHNGLYFYASSQLASKRVFSGHYDFYSTQLVPGRKIIISFLRDPVDRLISLYNFHKAHRSEVVERDNLVLARWARRYNIDEYFSDPEVRAHPAVNNSLARYLSDVPQLPGRWESSAAGQCAMIETMFQQSIANLDAFGFIGFMDRYDDCIQMLSRLLGHGPVGEIQPKQVLDQLMNSNPGMEEIEKQRPSALTLESMEDLVYWDRLVYAEARRRFLGAGA